MHIDLIWLSQNTELSPRWLLGQLYVASPQPAAIYQTIETYLNSSSAPYCLLWDSTLGQPDEETVCAITQMPGDLWHAGLCLGLGGQPGLIDFINPTWMLNRDPDPTIEATSWRLSLQACLMRAEVLRQMGNIKPEFQSLTGAALEMGHRCVMHGVIPRHVPWLLPNQGWIRPSKLPFADELRFTYYRYGRFWSNWALGRALLSGYISLQAGLQAWRQVTQNPPPSEPAPFIGQTLSAPLKVEQPRISVLIPTLDRYSYLRTVLSQLQQQTIKPFEIIIVDQSPKARRDTSLVDDFADLPLKILYQDQLGQCSSRNAGIKIAQGEYILFIDDDDEVLPTLISDHLHTLQRFQIQVSSGVADEIGAGPLPIDFTYTRVSNVFPTNNTMICRNVLQQSGLFDLAYERGQNEDGDLGMRIYLSGVLMILHPEIRVLHHHAPRGGLRTHGARVITYASSRQYLTHRNLPSVTEIYLAMRYFSLRQVREMLWLRALGTFSIRGTGFKKILKVFISMLYLPSTLWQIHRRYQQATMMMDRFPEIPPLTK